MLKAGNTNKLQQKSKFNIIYQLVNYGKFSLDMTETSPDKRKNSDPKRSQSYRSGWIQINKLRQEILLWYYDH